MLKTYTHFLRKLSLYDEEKPYSLRFTPPEGFPRSNISLDRHEIEVRDMRSEKDKYTFEKDGFAVVDLHTSLGYEEFGYDDKVKEVYLQEVADMLKDHLGASHVQIFEHVVRKQHEIFPISTGETYEYNQPTSIAHVDTTLPWALGMAQQLNPGNKEILARRIQCVNVWKPLVGPIQDWPLAICHPRSVNPNRLEPCDLVYPDYVVENRQVYHSPELEWVYLKGQKESEALIFLQADTDSNCLHPIVHSSFPILDKDPGQMAASRRESIEARALVYY